MALPKRRLKTQEERKIYEKIFDNLTIRDLFKLKAKKIYESFIRFINEGKESKVLLVSSDEGLRVIKIYKVEASSFKRMWYYLEGDERFKRIGKGKRDVVYAWCKKEYYNLEIAYNLGLNVPKPIHFIRNIVVMEFIGDEEGREAPQLRRVKLENPEEFFKNLIDQIKRLVRIGKLVHADLSEFNVLVKYNNPYIVDFGQAVLISHPKAKEFFERDINNITHYFKKYYNLDIDSDIIKKEIGRGIFYV